MKFPEIFALTKREQRAIIVIVLMLLAAAIAGHYRQHQRTALPATSPAPESSAAPSSTPVQDEDVAEPGE